MLTGLICYPPPRAPTSRFSRQLPLTIFLRFPLRSIYEYLFFAENPLRILIRSCPSVRVENRVSSGIPFIPVFRYSVKYHAGYPGLTLIPVIPKNTGYTRGNSSSRINRYKVSNIPIPLETLVGRFK